MSSQIKNKNLEIFLYRKKLENSLFSSYISLTISGLLIYPLQRLVVIKQGFIEAFPKKPIMSYQQCFNKIIENQNFLGFFKGASIFVGLNTIRHYFIYKSVFKERKNVQILKKQNINFLDSLKAFELAYQLEFLFYPFQRYLTLVQQNLDKHISKKDFQSKFLIGRSFLKDSKLNIYKGFLFSTPRLILQNYLLIQSCQYFNKNQSLNNQYTQVFTFGIINLLLFPLQCLTIRMQSDSLLTNYRYYYKNSLDCIQQIYKKEGIQGFYKGLTLYLPTQILKSVMVVNMYQYYILNRVILQLNFIKI